MIVDLYLCGMVFVSELGQMVEIPVKYYMWSWTVFSRVFVWVMGTTIFKTGPVLHKRAIWSHQSFSHLQWMSIKIVCFCHWQAQIVMISVWWRYERIPTETLLLKSKILLFNVKQTLYCSCQSQQTIHRNIKFIIVIRTSVKQEKNKTLQNLFGSCFTVPRITSNSGWVEIKKK